MRQRVVIAIAIANNPRVLIADESTTALDVTIQAQILDVIKVAQRETGAVTIMITHDMGVVAGIADCSWRAGRRTRGGTRYAGHRIRRPGPELAVAHPRGDRAGGRRCRNRARGADPIN